MGTIVRDAHNLRQVACAFGAVDIGPVAVHPTYMPGKKKKPTKTPKFSHHFLKEWRKKRGFTQEVLAEQVDRSHATIQRIENRTLALTQPVLDQLARALRTSRGKILDEPPTEHD